MINIELLTKSRASMKFFPAGRGKRAEGQAGRLLHLRGEGQASDAWYVGKATNGLAQAASRPTEAAAIGTGVSPLRARADSRPTAVWPQARTALSFSRASEGASLD